MRARPALRALVAALTLPLAACAGAGAQPDAITTPAAEPVTTPAPTESAEPSATSAPATERMTTENGLVSIEVPAAWSVEHGGERIDDDMWSQTMLVRDADGGAMAWLSVGRGGDRGGFCGKEVDGVTVPDEDGMAPARIHLAETIEHGEGASSVLVAATRSFEELDGGGYDFHVGFLPEEPAGDLVPCLWYDDVATPAGFPNVMLGTPPVDLSGDRWAVDSFEAGEAYVQTEEFALLIEMMRSLELHP